MGSGWSIGTLCGGTLAVSTEHGPCWRKTNFLPSIADQQTTGKIAQARSGAMSLPPGKALDLNLRGGVVLPPRGLGTRID